VQAGGAPVGLAGRAASVLVFAALVAVRSCCGTAGPAAMAIEVSVGYVRWVGVWALGILMCAGERSAVTARAKPKPRPKPPRVGPRPKAGAKKKGGRRK
jgi:hypothetical protein